MTDSTVMAAMLGLRLRTGRVHSGVPAVTLQEVWADQPKLRRQRVDWDLKSDLSISMEKHWGQDILTQGDICESHMVQRKGAMLV